MVVCEDLKLKNQREIEQLRISKSSLSKRCKTLEQPYEEDAILAYPDAIEDESTPSEHLQAKLAELNIQI